MDTIYSLGVPQVLIMVSLIGFAVWQRGWLRLFLSIAVIIWGVFIIPIDGRIAVLFLTPGAILLLMAILNLIEKGESSDA